MLSGNVIIMLSGDFWCSKRLAHYAEVMDCPYYHQKIDRLEAEQRLKVVGKDGCFLVRDSGSNQGVYILCLM